MPSRERQQKNNPGKYTADIWGNQLEQQLQGGGKRRGKQKTVLINGVPHVQGTLFHGEDLRPPFPNAPLNKVPDRLGMSDEPGTLFSRPDPEPQASQNALFVTPTETATAASPLPAREDNRQDQNAVPLPVDSQVGELPDDLKPFVTYVPWHLFSEEQKRGGVTPYVTTTFFIYFSPEFGYIPGIMLQGENNTRRPESYGVTTRPGDIHAAYEQIRKLIDVQGLRQEAALQDRQATLTANPANKDDAPEPTPAASEGERNPLLAILNEDEIYVDPNEVTIEEAEENGYPLLRRDVVTYKWWLEFPFDTREQPELNLALKENKWRWGGYRQQWFTPAHFPSLPKDMPYANAGGAFYSEENAQRIEARATKAQEKSSAHYERSNQLAEVIPFGQPMMPDHYSYRSDLSYRKKIWRQMDLFVEFYKKAEWLENRAEGSRRLQRRKSNIATMQNRIDTLSATLRGVRREYEAAKHTGETDLDYYRKRMTILAGEILPLQAGIQERGGLPIEKAEAERPLQPGDLIQIRGRAMYVVKVNQKTIKVADPRVHNARGEMWELTYKKSDFQRLLATKEELEARKQQDTQEPPLL